MVKRFDETNDFINTVLTEANWTQANIKVKLNEEDKKDGEAITDPNAPASNSDGNEDEDEDEEDMEESSEYTLSYDACPLCESGLENDDVIFENIDTHFGTLLSIVEKAQSIQEGEDVSFDDLITESHQEGTCPLCESHVEDDSLVLANMNEHFDVVLEMLEELENEPVVEAKKPVPVMKKMPKGKKV